MPLKRRHRARRSILVVDDDPSLLLLVKAMLTGDGFRVLLAHEAGDALRLLEQEGLRIDLVLTDIRMPGTDGLELARQLLVSRPGLRILFMSAFYDREIVGVSVLGEGVGFVPKPFQSGGLLDKVRRALESPAPAPAMAGQ